MRSRKRNEPAREVEPFLSEPQGAHLEVLFPDGSIATMKRKAIRQALREGKLTRFSLFRRVESSDVQFSAYGYVKQKPPKQHPWQAIGWTFDKETSHISHAARGAMMQRDTVGYVAGGIAMILLTLYLGIGLYAAEAKPEKWSEEANEAASSAPNPDWRFKALYHLVGFTTDFFPEMAVFLAKSLVFVIGLIPAAGLSVGIAFVGMLIFDVGYRISHYDPEDKPQKAAQPASDGYPWKFWKSWEQKRLLRRARG